MSSISENHKKETFLKKVSPLFWWMRSEDVQNLPFDSIVETVLNYGDESEIKEMFLIYGLEKVAQSFFSKLENERDNYLSLTKHFFNLYFNRHASKNLI